MRLKLLAFAVATGITAGCAHQSPNTETAATRAIEPVNVPRIDEPLLPGSSPEVIVDTPTLAPVASFEEIEAGKTLWSRMRGGMTLVGQQSHPRLDKQIKRYAAHQKYFDKVFQRAERYLHFITNEIESRGLPMELALLPVVESAFDPFAYSHSHAAGLWQFIPSTGKRFGLDRNWWYEGRRDVVASTGAALDYLTYLNKLFDGDWLLALAAYNCGEGNVRRAVRKNKQAGKPIDFWSLKLPKQTSMYVPQLLAISEIVHDPDHHNIKLMALADKPYFERIELDAQMDLAQAAKMAGIELNELYLLNPAYNRWTTPPGDKQPLLLPKDCVDCFEQALATTPKEQWIATREYIVKSGDSLGRIASKNNVSVKDLRRENNLSNDLIRVGQIIAIPGAGGSAPRGAGQNSYYTVSNGDSLWDIARAHNVRVKDLRAWNNLAPSDYIQPGQQLQVGSTRHKLPTTNRKLSYKVRRGDSLARIANKFNVNIKDIVSWNKINPSKYLQPGQQLVLFIDIRSI